MYVDNNVSKSFDAFLVQLHDSQKVLELAKSRSPDAVGKLSEIISEALDSNLTEREAEIAADILIDLANKLETTIRASLSVRLSALDQLPLRLALHLANDEAEVAIPFLENSAALSDVDLFYIIQSKGKEHWAAIAKRQDLSEDLISLLVKKEDVNTTRNLIRNENVTFSDAIIKMLQDFVSNHSVLVREFVTRKELSQALILELYWKVNESEREFIAEFADVDMGMVDEQMEDSAADFANVIFGNLIITTEMQDTAKRLKERQMLNIAAMVRTLKSGQIGLFYAQFSEYSAVPLSVMDQVFVDDKGKAFAIIAKALDLDKSVFVSFFVQTRKLRRIGKGVDHKMLFKALEHYNNLTVDAAKSLMPRIIQQEA